MSRYVSLAVAAEHFDVTTEALRLGIASGELPGVLRVGRVYRVDLDALTEHFAKAVHRPAVGLRPPRPDEAPRPRRRAAG